MKRYIRWLAVCMLTLAVGSLGASCTLLRPSFRSPIRPFAVQPTGAAQLAQHMKALQPPVASLGTTQLEVIAQGDNIKGKQKFTLLMRYQAPGQILMKATSRIWGPLFQVTQSDEDVAIYFHKQGLFYRGSMAELESVPQVLFGVRPLDITRALLVSQNVAGLLQNPEKVQLTQMEKFWNLAVPVSSERAESYLIRRSDGLVQEIAVFDMTKTGPQGPPVRISVKYHRYKQFNGSVFPSDFELLFPNTNLRLKVKLAKIIPNTKQPEALFALEPPAALANEIRPLSELLKQIDPRLQQFEEEQTPPNNEDMSNFRKSLER